MIKVVPLMYFVHMEQIYVIIYKDHDIFPVLSFKLYAMNSTRLRRVR